MLVCVFPYCSHVFVGPLQKFIETDPSPRKDATVIQVKEGNEPASFKALFPSWDDALFEVPTSGVRTPLSMAGGSYSLHLCLLSLTLPHSPCRLLCRPVRDLVCLDMSYCANTCGEGLADKDHLTALSAVGFFRSLFAWLVLGDLLDRNKFCHFGKWFADM